MLTKETVIAHIKDLPENFSLDELMEKLLFLYKLEMSLEQSKNKLTTPHETVKEQFKKKYHIDYYSYFLFIFSDIRI